MKRLTLCADDYAFNEAVSRGIVQLAEAGRLSAISCMSLSHHWPEHAQWLTPLRGRVDIGLHLTLTELPPLGAMPQLAPEGKFPSLGKLLLASQLRQLPAAEIAAELERQMVRFIDHFGRAPDFLDGHQHVHILPGVREATLDLWARYLKPQGGYLRSCHEPLGAIVQRRVEPLKAFIISRLSARFTQLALQRGALSNDSFRGVHDFSGRTPPEQLFPAFLRGVGERPLVMCHPGLAGNDNGDLLQSWRPRELAYLSSEQFLRDLADAGVTLAPLPRNR